MAQWSAAEWQAWRSGEWASNVCACGTAVWTGAKKCRNCGVIQSYRQAAAPTMDLAPVTGPKDGTEGPSKTRSKLAADLQRLEAALAQLPQVASATKRADRILEQKRAMSACEPVGHQLEDAKAALQRARQRKEKASRCDVGPRVVLQSRTRRRASDGCRQRPKNRQTQERDS